MTSSENRAIQAETCEIALFEAVMEAHESALLRYVSGLIRDAHSAQDVVQKVFIKLFERSSKLLLPEDRLRHWLYRVAHNEAIDHIRRESRLRRLHESQAPDLEQTATATTQADTAKDRLEEALALIRKLKPAEQQVLLLRFQEGLSYQEISRVTGRSEGNVGCLLHHALRKLTNLLSNASARRKN